MTIRQANEAYGSKTVQQDLAAIKEYLKTVSHTQYGITWYAHASFVND